MAGCDYRKCDICGNKTFYDADLNYMTYKEMDDCGLTNDDCLPYKVSGKQQYEDPEINEKYGYRLINVGDWAVICQDCAKTYKTNIVKITENNK